MEITRSQRERENAAQFRSALSVLHQAAVSVILCRTREPARATETIRDFAFAEKLPFKSWTVLTGWQSFDYTKPDADPTVDNATEPFAALRAIQPPTGDGFPNGIYVMQHPHHWVPKHPGMMQALKDYSRDFPQTLKRLVLICPLGFTLPQELEDDIVILDFDTPSYGELNAAAERLIGDVSSARRPRLDEESMAKLVSVGIGMTKHEFENALSRALVTHRQRLPNVSVDDLSGVLMEVKTEVVKRSEVLEVMPTENMTNVGGLENLKAWVAKRRKCFTDEAKEFGIEAPKGAALIGPPGTGKSLSAKAIAYTLGLPLIKFDVGRVFNSLVGSSEARVRAALKMVDAMAPCVLMIDEVDKAFQANSGGGDSGVSQRVLGAILTWMQETKSPVFVVATANRVNNLPSEFLRRGRLDEVFSVSTPDETERLDIIRIHLRKRGHDPEAVENLEAAAAKSNGYVPAELEAAVKDALIEAFDRDEPVTGDLIAEMLGGMVPLSEAFKEDFEAMQRWAEQNARPASANRTRGVPVQARTRSRPAPGTHRAVSLDG